MSDPHSGEEPRNPHVQHEPGDVDARALTKFGLTMSGLIVVFLFGLWGLFEYFVRHEAAINAPPSPAAMVNSQKQPPEPRLQPDPVRDLRQMQSDENRLLRQYAWVDPDKGVVKIPIDRAMDLVAQRGLPVWPQGKKK